ncbi:MAG: hypothetical protein IOD03_18805, partial [Methylocystis sp.]|nr:hypothetical protein [Methylocystis sp.]
MFTQFCGLAGLPGAFMPSPARPKVTIERRIAPAKSRPLALALWFLALLGCGAAMPALSPRAAMAEALVPDTAIQTANLPITQARGGARSFAVELAGGAGVFEIPEAAARSPVPAVLILHDALGADGRAASDAEQLLGANIAVLELREGSTAAAGAALAALAADPRINPAQLGILGFGTGARLAMELPGTAARA